MALEQLSTVQTRHQKVEIWKAEGRCEFRVAGAAHALWHHEQFLTGRAWDTLAAASLLRPDGPPESLLMLGLAGGTTLRILRHLLPDCRFTAVDLDEELVTLAREHMHLDELQIEVHIAEAYDWTTNCDEHYDVIIDDCYLAGEDAVFRPEKKPGRGVELCASHLNPGGILLSNLLTGSGHGRMQSKTRAAYRRQFPAVSSVTSPESETEALVGGPTLLAGGDLSSWGHQFPNTKDREFWSWLEVKALK